MSTFFIHGRAAGRANRQMRDTEGAGENRHVRWRGSNEKIAAGGLRAKETAASEEETEWLFARGGEVWERGQHRNNRVGCCLIRFHSFHFLPFSQQNNPV